MQARTRTHTHTRAHTPEQEADGVQGCRSSGWMFECNIDEAIRSISEGTMEGWRGGGRNQNEGAGGRGRRLQAYSHWRKSSFQGTSGELLARNKWDFVEVNGCF